MVLYQPADVIFVDVKTTAELSCVSNEPLQAGTLISWYRRSWTTGGNISLVKSCASYDDMNKYVCNNNRYVATLQIHNTQTSDSGVYFCSYYYHTSNIIANGTSINVRESSTPNGFAHLLVHIQQSHPIRTVQLACVVHEIRPTVRITWNISGTHHKGTMTSIQRPGGAWTFINIILLHKDKWDHEDRIKCEVSFGSIPVLIHWQIPVEVAEKTFISTCSLFLRSFLTAIVLLIFMIAIHLSHTYV
ncbi:uncharacterized protein LOC142664573 [Rhinoderma darwinii]|uniref:uncharacterized protein LOC142664573 n=1 Tax=Rhinoderma darwinii TaxID=43563 RepID=UPI003F679A89